MTNTRQSAIRRVQVQEEVRVTRGLNDETSLLHQSSSMSSYEEKFLKRVDMHMESHHVIYGST